MGRRAVQCYLVVDWVNPQWLRFQRQLLDHLRAVVTGEATATDLVVVVVGSGRGGGEEVDVVHVGHSKHGGGVAH